MRKYFAIALLGFLFACSNTDQKNSENLDSVSTKAEAGESPEVELADKEVSEIYTTYIALKNDLVATNFQAAQASAKALEDDLMKKQGCENTAAIATKISNAKDIAEQRSAFTALSNDVIAMFKHSEIKTGTIYVQRCPMANNGDGGEWLSSRKEIRNPYYGDEMMECGSVIEEIKK